MTDPIAGSAQVPARAAAPRPGAVGASESELTADPVVDEVLRSLVGVRDRPLAEQVTVFDEAHARLQAVLADAADDAAV